MVLKVIALAPAASAPVGAAAMPGAPRTASEAEIAGQLADLVWSGEVGAR